MVKTSNTILIMHLGFCGSFFLLKGVKNPSRSKPFISWQKEVIIRLQVPGREIRAEGNFYLMSLSPRF